jgi:hypothetical protein
MSVFPALEKNLDSFFSNKTPELSDGGKRLFVHYLPWLNLILGIVAAYTIYAIWHWAHAATNLINYANTLSAAYGGPRINPDRLSFAVWLSMIVLAVDAVLYFAACHATRQRQKSGWDLMFYGLLVNAVYGVVVLFTNYGDIGNLISAWIGTAIGLYLLFQCRAVYNRSKPAAPETTKKSK